MRISTTIYAVGLHWSSFIKGLKCALSCLGICDDAHGRAFSALPTCPAREDHGPPGRSRPALARGPKPGDPDGPLSKVLSVHSAAFCGKSSPPRGGAIFRQAAPVRCCAGVYIRLTGSDFAMQIISLLFLALIAAAPTPRATAADVAAADTIYFGGDVITVNSQQPMAEALAVRDGKIVAVGAKDDVFKLRGDDTRLVDLAGKALVPGFVDPHSHFMNALQVIHWANLSGPPVGPVTDIASLVEQLREIQKQTHPAPGEWIVGYGYDPDTLKEKRQLTRDDLDPHFPDNPVMVLHVSLHGCVLNSQAFEKVGIDANTPTPEGGVIVRKPGSNEPAGLLMENAFLPIVRKLPKLTEEQFIANLKATQLEYAKNGYTTVQEGATSVGDIRLLKTAAARAAVSGHRLVAAVHRGRPGSRQAGVYIRRLRRPLQAGRRQKPVRRFAARQDGLLDPADAGCRPRRSTTLARTVEHDPGAGYGNIPPLL